MKSIKTNILTFLWSMESINDFLSKESKTLSCFKIDGPTFFNFFSTVLCCCLTKLNNWTTPLKIFERNMLLIFCIINQREIYLLGSNFR